MAVAVVQSAEQHIRSSLHVAQGYFDMQTKGIELATFR